MSIASAPNCQVGSWTQQWNCGLHANQTGAHVGGISGHDVALFVGVLIGLLIIAILRSGGSRKAAAR